MSHDYINYTKQELDIWLADAESKGYAYLVIIQDNIDRTYYPVYLKTKKDIPAYRALEWKYVYPDMQEKILRGFWDIKTKRNLRDNEIAILLTMP